MIILTDELKSEMHEALVEALSGDDEVARRGAAGYLVELESAVVGEPMSKELIDVVEYFQIG